MRQMDPIFGKIDVDRPTLLFANVNDWTGSWRKSLKCQILDTKSSKCDNSAWRIDANVATFVTIGRAGLRDKTPFKVEALMLADF